MDALVAEEKSNLALLFLDEVWGEIINLNAPLFSLRHRIL